jgi:hypothetical protein
LAEKEGTEAVGETTVSDEVATFILRRGDTVMEAWQIANALTRMSQMIPRDKRRRKKLRQAAEYVVTNFVDEMVKEHLKEVGENTRRWREQVDLQDNSQRTERAMEKQEKQVTAKENDENEQVKRTHPRTGG